MKDAAFSLGEAEQGGERESERGSLLPRGMLLSLERASRDPLTCVIWDVFPPVLA